MRGQISRVDKMERTEGIHGPGCVWRGDDEEAEAAQRRYLEKWPKDVGKDIVILSWAPAPPPPLEHIG